MERSQVKLIKKIAELNKEIEMLKNERIQYDAWITDLQNKIDLLNSANEGKTKNIIYLNREVKEEHQKVLTLTEQIQSLTEDLFIYKLVAIIATVILAASLLIWLI